MNTERDLTRIVRSWLEEGVTALPDRVLDAVLGQVPATRQRRAWWPAGRSLPLRSLRRELVLAAVIVLLAAAAIAGAALVGAQLLRHDPDPFPKSLTGWITYAAGEASPAAALPNHDIFVIGEDRAPRRIVGTGSDNLDHLCPAFSTDATRIAFGEGRRTSDTGYRDSALVIANIDAQGVASNVRTIPVGGSFPPPCPAWSPDGRRIAFVVPPVVGAAQPAGAGDVWIVALDSGQVKILPGVWAGDLDWAPDSSRLAIASGNDPATQPSTGGPLLLFSVVGGVVHRIPGADGVTSLSWSPDGSRIAYQRIRTPATLTADGGVVRDAALEIWTIGPEGSGRTLETKPFDATHGIGPVWSPAGDRIAYQRICAVHPLGKAPCREQHEVVLLTPGKTVSETKPVGSEVVLPAARADGADGPAMWFPAMVSWSPDGQKLLYSAWSEAVTPGQPSPLGGGFVVIDVRASSPPFLLLEGDVATGDHPWGRLP
jgi:hypothetical protein